MPQANNPNALQSAYSQIKTALFGEPNLETQDLDTKVDDIISGLTDTMINKDVLNYSDSLKDIMTNKIDPYSFDDNIGQSILLSPDNLTRLNRYQNADEVAYAVPTLARALKVLADGILSPDNVTKTMIEIMQSGSSEQLDATIDNLKNINKRLNIDKMMNTVVPSLLKYGDYFLEICDYKSKDVPVTQSLQLTESFNPKEEFKDLLESGNVSFDEQNNEFVFKVKVLDESKTREAINQNKQDLKDLLETDESNMSLEEAVKYTTKDFRVQIVEEYSEYKNKETKNNDTLLSEACENITRLISDEELLEDIGNPLYHGGNAANNATFKNYKPVRIKDTTVDDIVREKNIDLSNIRIINHNPRNVVKIQSVRHRMNLGYLVIPEYGKYGGSRLGRGIGAGGSIHQR